MNSIKNKRQQDRMYDDILKAKQLLEKNLSTDVANRTYGQYYRLLNLYAITRQEIPEELVLSTEDNKRNGQIATPQIEILKNYVKNIELSKNEFRFISQCIRALNEYSDFYYIKDETKYKRFSQREFCEILMDFFAHYGYADVAYKYLVEGRINIIANQKEPCGEFIQLPILKTGYVKTVCERVDSHALSITAHELGHAIDAEKFHFPQQKKMNLFADLLLEMPSTCFETLFNDYLVQNHIDDLGGIYLKNKLDYAIINYLSLMGVSLSYENYGYTMEGNIIDTEKNQGIAGFRDQVIYGIGYYLAHFFLDIARQDPKEFHRIFNNIMTSRNELNTITDIGEHLEYYSPEEFYNGKPLVNIFLDDFTKLKRQIQK